MTQREAFEERDKLRQAGQLKYKPGCDKIAKPNDRVHTHGKFTPTLRKAILAALESSMSLRAVCASLDIGHSTLAMWRKQSRKFDEECLLARERAEANLVRGLEELSLPHDDLETTEVRDAKGKLKFTKTKKRRTGNPEGIQFLLKKKYPTEYGDHLDITSRNISVHVIAAAEQFDAKLSELLKIPMLPAGEGEDNLKDSAMFED